MPRPDYLICLECETEVEGFTWRDGEVRRAACDVCGNSDPDAFALPEDFDQDLEEEEDEAVEEEEDEDLIEEYDDYEDEDDE